MSNKLVPHFIKQFWEPLIVWKDIPVTTLCEVQLFYYRNVFVWFGNCDRGKSLNTNSDLSESSPCFAATVACVACIFSMADRTKPKPHDIAVCKVYSVCTIIQPTSHCWMNVNYTGYFQIASRRGHASPRWVSEPVYHSDITPKQRDQGARPGAAAGDQRAYANKNAWYQTRTALWASGSPENWSSSLNAFWTSFLV